MEVSIENLINTLSKVQFKTQLDFWSYLAILFVSAIGTYLASYLKKKGENVATKEDFNGLLNQLKTNTEAVEDIKSQFNERNWVNQQIWLKKQEAYSTIFMHLLNIKKYVTFQTNEFEAWQDINFYHEYFSFEYNKDEEIALKEKWENDRKLYEEKSKSPAHIEEAQLLKTNHDKSLSSIFDVINIHSIYLDPNVELELEKLKNELSTTHDYEDWEEHFSRISNETESTINTVREIGKRELRVKI